MFKNVASIAETHLFRNHKKLVNQFNQFNQPGSNALFLRLDWVWFSGSNWEDTSSQVAQNFHSSQLFNSCQSSFAPLKYSSFVFFYFFVFLSQSLNFEIKIIINIHDIKCMNAKKIYCDIWCLKNKNNKFFTFIIMWFVRKKSV